MQNLMGFVKQLRVTLSLSCRLLEPVECRTAYVYNDDNKTYKKASLVTAIL